jgi:hypothetical protein
MDQRDRWDQDHSQRPVVEPLGSNRYIGNAAGVAVAAKALPDMRDEYNCFAVSQLHYLWEITVNLSSSVPGKSPSKTSPQKLDLYHARITQ